MLKELIRKVVGNSNLEKVKVLFARFGKSSEFLNKLAVIYRSDKYAFHFYTPHYHLAFSPTRFEKKIILEIGIGGYNKEGEGGGSLKMWKSYFPNSQVYGIDILDKRFCDQKRIKTFIGSQTDLGFLDKVISEIGIPDIIIDDGSHHPSDIIKTFKYLFPKLSETGIYSIEDLQTSYWPDWGGKETVGESGTSIDFLKKLIDDLNYEEIIDPGYEASGFPKDIREIRFYHNLCLIFKGNNTEGSKMADERRIARKLSQQ